MIRRPQASERLSPRMRQWQRANGTHIVRRTGEIILWVLGVLALAVIYLAAIRLACVHP